MEIWKVTRHYSCSLSCFKNVTWNNPPAANSYFLTWKMDGVLKARYYDFPRVETIKNHAHVTWEYPFRNVERFPQFCKKSWLYANFSTWCVEKETFLILIPDPKSNISRKHQRISRRILQFFCTTRCKGDDWKLKSF